MVTRQDWIAALRSGQYVQGQRALRTESNTYCCLGVLCDISGLGEWSATPYGSDEVDEDVHSAYIVDDIEFDTELSDLPELLIEVNLTREEHNALIQMNDNGATFEDIASVLEYQSKMDAVTLLHEASKAATRVLWPNRKKYVDFFFGGDSD